MVIKGNVPFHLAVQGAITGPDIDLGQMIYYSLIINNRWSRIQFGVT